MTERMTVEQFMRDYARWVGISAKDYSEEPAASLNAMTYIEEFCEMAFTPYKEDVINFLKEFYNVGEITEFMEKRVWAGEEKE